MSEVNRVGTLISSDLAVEEARKYLQVKRPTQIDDFEALLETLEIVPSVLFSLPVELQEQDAPLLCTAIRNECPFFVTADKQYFGHLYDQQVQGTEIISLLRLAEILTEIESSDSRPRGAINALLKKRYKCLLKDSLYLFFLLPARISARCCRSALPPVPLVALPSSQFLSF